MMKPRLLLTDDHRLVLDALVLLLGDEFEVVGTASNGESLLELGPQLRPDVIVLDLTMPGMSGLEVLRVLRPRLPDTRFLMLTMHTDLLYVREAFAAGADGYLFKDTSPEGLVAAVWKVARGGRVVSPELGVDVEALAGAGPATRDGSGALTARQREVLQRVATGMACKSIASELGISLKTVEFHKSCIARQLGLRSTAALTRYALAHGLATPGGASRVDGDGG